MRDSLENTGSQQGWDENASNQSNRNHRRRKMLPGILIGLAALIVVLLIVIALQPSTFQVTRSAKISAPVGRVYDVINNMRVWNSWSPWARMDPNTAYTYEGPESGPGAGMHWRGNNKVGEGRMRIAESRPNELVRFDLQFIKPFANMCVTDFILKPDGDATNVTWTMSGPQNFISKGFGLFMNMDKMVGGQFEEGLGNLRKVSETPSHA
jgi:hypothetical protein